MIQPTKDYVIFEIEQEYASTLVGQDGFKLDLILAGGAGDQLKHITEWGTVLAVPHYLNPLIGSRMELQVGDKIYFHFHTVCDDNKYTIDGKVCYKVHYLEVFCAVRDGAIRMVNDYLLTKPVMESEVDIRSASGIFLKPEPEPIPLRAIVHHLSPGSTLSIGDEIIYAPNSDCTIVVEGQEYYRMRHRDVLGSFVRA